MFITVVEIKLYHYKIVPHSESIIFIFSLFNK